MAYQTTCLGNLIALQGGCDPVTPTSGLYGSSIGISRDFIDQIITKEYPDALTFWNEKKNMAIEIISNALHSSFSPHYKTASLLKNYRVGHPNDNKVAVAGNSALKGIYYNLEETSSYYDLFISELSLFVNVTQDVEVKVYDLLQGTVIDTITVPCTAGEISKVFPAKKYKSQSKRLSLFFAYDSTGINSYKTSLQAGGCSNCGGSDYISSTYHRIQAGTIPLASDKILSSFSGLSETGGMSINHSLECNHSDWLCAVSGLIALPILYKTAAVIIEFALDESPNTRSNTNVTLNREILKERLDRYELKWRESLDNIIRNVKVPQDNKCFICNKNVVHQPFAL